MRFYTNEHRFYCGVDLHARTMYLCILDQAGQVVFGKNLPATGQAFLHAIAPFRDGQVVAVECLFCWYWLADLCKTEKIAFVLGHALYMRAIHGGKSKNDQIDAGKIARLLRGGTLPQAYVYPAGMRATRDLLRRRMYLVHKRAETIAHVQNTNSQYNYAPFGKKLAYAANRAELQVAERFTDPSVRRMIDIDLAPIFGERLLLNSTAVRQGKPLVDCAMFELETQLTTVLPGATPCLACLYGAGPPGWQRQFPVFGAVAGTIGCLGAMETIKVLTGLGRPLANYLLVGDLSEMTFRKVQIKRNPGCPVCQGV